MRHMRVNDSVGDPEEAYRCQPSADSLQPLAEKPAQKWLLNPCPLLTDVKAPGAWPTVTRHPNVLFHGPQNLQKGYSFKP